MTSGDDGRTAEVRYYEVGADEAGAIVTASW